MHNLVFINFLGDTLMHKLVFIQFFKYSNFPGLQPAIREIKEINVGAGNKCLKSMQLQQNQCISLNLKHEQSNFAGNIFSQKKWNAKQTQKNPAGREGVPVQEGWKATEHASKDMRMQQFDKARLCMQRFLTENICIYFKNVIHSIDFEIHL